MARWIDTSETGFRETFDAFLAEPRGEVDDVAQTVRDVIADVRKHGGEAVARYTSKFDRLTLDPATLQSDNVDLHALAAGCPGDLREAIDFAAERIAAYHEKQRPSDNILRMLPASNSVGSGRRSTASVSMCRAVWRPIPALS